MTAEEMVKSRLVCTCSDLYKNRNMADPSCVLCDYGSEIVDLMEQYAKEKVLKAMGFFKAV